MDRQGAGADELCSHSGIHLCFGALIGFKLNLWLLSLC